MPGNWVTGTMSEKTQTGETNPTATVVRTPCGYDPRLQGRNLPPVSTLHTNVLALADSKLSSTTAARGVKPGVTDRGKMVQSVTSDAEGQGERGVRPLCIANHSTVFRSGLASIFRDLPAVGPITECDRLSKLYDVLRAGGPMVVCLDVEFGGQDVTETVGQVIAIAPCTEIILFTSHATEDLQGLVLRNLVRGVILKDSPLAELTSALSLIVASDRFRVFPDQGAEPPLGPATMVHPGEPAPTARLSRQDPGAAVPVADGRAMHPPACAPSDLLIERQRTVLGLLAQGLSNKEIANQLNLVENTVKIHVREIIRALRVRNRTQAALVAHGYLKDR